MAHIQSSIIDIGDDPAVGKAMIITVIIITILFIWFHWQSSGGGSVVALVTRHRQVTDVWDH